MMKLACARTLRKARSLKLTRATALCPSHLSLVYANRPCAFVFRITLGL